MRKIRIAITGGIGSGKSTASQCIRDMGYSVFSCDEIYREIIHAPHYIEKISEQFPTSIVNGKIDREILSQIVFDDPKKRLILNQIAHPLVMQSLVEQMNNCESKLVFAEVPLLFEGNFENCFDQVIVIMRERSDRLLAVQKRDGIPFEAIEKRMQSQFDYQSNEGSERLKKCNAHLVENDGSIEKLKLKLKKIISNL